MRHELEKDGNVITTNVTYLRSFVTQKFRNRLSEFSQMYVNNSSSRYIYYRNSVTSIILIVSSPPRYEISSVILHQINNDKIQTP